MSSGRNAAESTRCGWRNRRIELLPVESDARWEDLLSRQPGATLFHTMGWLRFLESHFPMRLVPLVAHHHGSPVGLFPLFVRRRWLLRVGSSPHGVDTLFLGPLVPDELLGELLDAYDRWARSQRLDYSAVAFAHQIDAATAEARGYVCRRYKYSVVDLHGGEEAVFARFTSEGRRKVRLAEKRGVTIVEGDFAPHYDLYVALSEKVFERSNQKTLLTRPVLAAMIETLRRQGCLLSMRAEVDGQVAGLWIGGHYGKTMYGLDTVSDRAFINYAVGSLMNWHAIQWSCRKGLEAVDFGGSRIRSLAVFKASFGGKEHYYSNITKAHSPLARAAAWMARTTVSRLRTTLFRRSQKGRVQARQGPPGERE